MVEQHAVDPALPGLGEVIDQVGAALVGAAPAGAYEDEIARAVQRVATETLIGLAASADMPQVRAIASFKLKDAKTRLEGQVSSMADDLWRAHASLLARDITRFLDNPETFKRPAAIAIPPGAPIGDPSMDWVDWLIWRR